MILIYNPKNSCFSPIPIPRFLPSPGDVEDIRVVSSKAIAFVRYTWRCNAEFAKEAMAGQRLGRSKCAVAADGGEI